MEEKEIWICNECGLNLLSPYCVNCCSANCEKVEKAEEIL